VVWVEEIEGAMNSSYSPEACVAIIIRDFPAVRKNPAEWLWNAREQECVWRTRCHYALGSAHSTS
jgi:hypothetical protein